MGDTVNLAARLVAKAPVGRIYATRDVLRRARRGG
jgi:class 3 adenylate cyclase